MNKVIGIIFILSAIMCYVASLFSFLANEVSIGCMWVCIGSLDCCVGVLLIVLFMKKINHKSVD